MCAESSLFSTTLRRLFTHPYIHFRGPSVTLLARTISVDMYGIIHNYRNPQRHHSSLVRLSLLRRLLRPDLSIYPSIAPPIAKAPFHV